MGKEILYVYFHIANGSSFFGYNTKTVLVTIILHSDSIYRLEIVRKALVAAGPAALALDCTVASAVTANAMEWLPAFTSVVHDSAYFYVCCVST